MTMLVHDSHEVVMDIESESDSHVLIFFCKNVVSGKLQPVFSVGGDKEQLQELVKRISRKVEKL